MRRPRGHQRGAASFSEAATGRGCHGTGPHALARARGASAESQGGWADGRSKRPERTPAARAPPRSRPEPEPGIPVPPPGRLGLSGRLCAAARSGSPGYRCPHRADCDRADASARAPPRRRLYAAALSRRPGYWFPLLTRAPTFRGAPRNRKCPGPRRRDQAERKSLREAVATTGG